MATLQDVCTFLKEAGTYHLATLDGDQPHVRPFGTAELFEGKLYLQTGKSKKVFAQITAHPKVEIEACKGADWLRVSGTLVVDERIEAKKHMLDAYPSLRNMYDEHDDNTAVLYFTHAKATFASLAGTPGWTLAWD